MFKILSSIIVNEKEKIFPKLNIVKVIRLFLKNLFIQICFNIIIIFFFINISYSDDDNLNKILDDNNLVKIIDIINNSNKKDEILIHNYKINFNYSDHKNKLKYQKISNFLFAIDEIDVDNGLLFKSNFHENWKIFFLRDRKYKKKVSNILKYYPFDGFFLNELVYKTDIQHIRTVNGFNFYYLDKPFPSNTAILFFEKNKKLKQLYFISLIGVITTLFISIIFVKRKNET